MADHTCPSCGQPMPTPERRDPPLPPLDQPAIVTIHDLPAEERGRVKITGKPGYGYFWQPAGKAPTPKAGGGDGR